jgi:transcriptional regulator with XRE-family HTH domain
MDVERLTHTERFRALAHFSKADLARAAGVSYNRVSRYLAGGPIRFTVEERRRLGSALDRHEAFALLDRSAAA